MATCSVRCTHIASHTLVANAHQPEKSTRQVAIAGHSKKFAVQSKASLRQNHQSSAPFTGPLPKVSKIQKQTCTCNSKRSSAEPLAASSSSGAPPDPEDDVIGSLVGHLGLSEHEARALTGALLDGVGKVMEKEHGASTAQQFSAAFPDLTDWKKTARDILDGQLEDNRSSRRSGGGLGDVLGDVLGGRKEEKRSGGGLGDVLGDVLGGGKEKSRGGGLGDIFGGGEKKRSNDGGLGGKIGDILGDVLKGGDDERGNGRRRYEEDVPRDYEYEAPKKKDKGLGGGIASSVGHLLLNSFFGIGELKLATTIIRKLGVDPMQTLALAYLLVKFMKGRVGPDIFGKVLASVPLFKLVMDGRNPIVKRVLGALKTAVLR